MHHLALTVYVYNNVMMLLYIWSLLRQQSRDVRYFFGKTRNVTDPRALIREHNFRPVSQVCVGVCVRAGVSVCTCVLWIPLWLRTGIPAAKSGNHLLWGNPGANLWAVAPSRRMSFDAAK